MVFHVLPPPICFSRKIPLVRSPRAVASCAKTTPSALSTRCGWLAPAQPPACCPSAWPQPPHVGGPCKHPRTRQGERLCPLHPACSPGCAGSVRGPVLSLGSGPAPCSSAGSHSRPRDVGARGRCRRSWARAGPLCGQCTGSWAGRVGGGRAREGGGSALPMLRQPLSCHPVPFAVGLGLCWCGASGTWGPGVLAAAGRAGAGAAGRAGARGPSPPAPQGEGQGASALQSSWPRTRRK